MRHRGRKNLRHYWRLDSVANNINIKQLRQASQLSQQDVTRLVNIPLRTYKRLESGDSGAKLETFLCVLDVFGVTIQTVSKRRPVLDELAAIYGDDGDDGNVGNA
jgi:DNA-binding XRE family transcriptional regulator